MKTIAEIAEILNGYEYASTGFDKALLSVMNICIENKYVIFHASSDDIGMLDGSINDEFYTTAYFLPSGKMIQRYEDDCYECFESEAINAYTVEFLSRGAPLCFKTDIPHVTFDILEDEDNPNDLYCQGIIIDLNNIVPQDQYGLVSRSVTTIMDYFVRPIDDKHSYVTARERGSEYFVDSVVINEKFYDKIDDIKSTEDFSRLAREFRRFESCSGSYAILISKDVLNDYLLNGAGIGIEIVRSFDEELKSDVCVVYKNDEDHILRDNNNQFFDSYTFTLYIHDDELNVELSEFMNQIKDDQRIREAKLCNGERGVLVCVKVSHTVLLITPTSGYNYVRNKVIKHLGIDKFFKEFNN